MDASADSKATAVHVLIFPFPAQGHLTSMLKLAELLSLAGLRVTFINTDHNDALLGRFSAAYARLSLNQRFHFRTIPEGLDDDNIDSLSATGFMKLEESLRGPRAMASFKNILVENGSQSVTCAVIDGLLVRPIEAAEGLGIPTIAFRTSSSCSFLAYFCIPILIQNGEIPFPDDADMDELIRSVPGMKGMLRRRDLPSFIGRARTVEDPKLHLVSSVTTATTRARGIIFNTIESLEAPVLASIRSHCPNTYTLGPLHLLLNAHTADKQDLSGSLWQEDRSCMSWLDSQENRSVVYISFGSLTMVSPDELLEFWHGLVGSGRPFLWVLRPGMAGDGLPSPPDELAEATRERGCLVGWVPQGEVLAHPAVGCFVTHSGWNSTLESMAAGVPMVCWPFFADQQINSRFASEVWGVGLDMKDRCRREVVEGMVRAAMEGEEIRRAAAEMAETARRCVEEGGSSESDFRRLVRDIESLSLTARVPNSG